MSSATRVSMAEVSIHEAKKRLSSLLAGAVVGEEIVIDAPLPDEIPKYFT